jgi:hypothetical protein
MTINIPTAAASSSAPTHQTRPLLAFTLPFFALAAGSLAVGGRKKKLAFWVVLLLVLALGAVSIGCGGGSSKSSAATTATQSTPAAGASSYTVTVNASAGAIQHSTSLNVTVN